MGKICTLFSSSQEPETVRCLTRAIGNFGHSEQGCNYILSHAAAMEKVCELLSSRQERDISEDVVKVLENIESGARKQMGDIKNAKTSVTAPQGYGHLPSDKAPCLISATALAILANHATCQKGDLKVQSACEQLIKLYLVRYCFDENYKPVLTDLSQSTTWSKNGGRQLASTALATL